MHNHLLGIMIFFLLIVGSIGSATYIAATAEKKVEPSTSYVEGTGLKDTTPWARTLSETGIGGKK